MSDDSKSVITRFLNALGSGDTAAMGDLLAPDARACAKGTSAFSITRDREAILQAAGMLTASIPEGIQFEILSLTAEGDRVVAEAQGRAKLGNGTDYNNSYAFVATVADGKIMHLNEYFCTKLVEDVLIPYATR
jgi:uncharacterized protein